MVDRPLTASCDLCEVVTELAGSGLLVHETPEWVLHVNPRYKGPALWVQVRKHTEGLWSLSDEQASSLGPLLVRAASALRCATAAIRVYAVSFGEAHPHYHMLLMPRSDDQGVETRGPVMIQAYLASGASDRSKLERLSHARRFAADIRAEFQRDKVE